MRRLLFTVTFLLAPPLAATELLPARIVGGLEHAGTPADAPRAEDFALEWVTDPIQGVQWRVEPSSLEWMRLDRLALPRARIWLTAERAEGGTITHGGVSQPLLPLGDKAEADVTVAMLSHPRNRVEIRIRRQGKTISGALGVRFLQPKGREGSRIFADSACSPYKVDVERIAGDADDWIYVGCRLLRSPGEVPTPVLELTVYWDGAAETVMLDDSAVTAADLSTWIFRLGSRPGKIRLGNGGRQIAVQYRIADRYRAGRLGLGIGPYLFTFKGGGENTVGAVRPVPTLYFSLGLGEGLRLVAFDMSTAGSSSFLTDFGTYLNFAYLRAFDNRMVLNLMLGAHAVAFTVGGLHVAPDLAQGAEILFSDAFVRGGTFALGGFVYPDIKGVFYYNTWVRWGPPGLFFELNYIDWRKVVSGKTFESSIVGLSVGFPLFAFL